MVSIWKWPAPARRPDSTSLFRRMASREGMDPGFFGHTLTEYTNIWAYLQDAQLIVVSSPAHSLNSIQATPVSANTKAFGMWKK